MDMDIFQVESNKRMPRVGDVIIASPFLYDYYFSRTVTLIVAHDIDGYMGVIMNKELPTHTTLNELLPELKSFPTIPIQRGGPVDEESLFYVHTLSHLRDSFPIGDGLYLNGDFDQLLQYILDGNPVEGHIRFFSGCTGWVEEHMEKDVTVNNTWLVSKVEKNVLLDYRYKRLWQRSMATMGLPYSIWAKYPEYPSCN